MRSNMTFNPYEAIDNYTIQCTVDTTVSCHIMVPGVPARSEINGFDVTPTYVNISWPISTHPCFEEYRLLTTSPNNPNTLERIFDRSITSILLPISQLNDTEYSYGIYISDTGNRFIEPQLTRMLTPN
uniref:Fibronectin type-III domain-containing protein n=1 Tax=Amphimedon queenslandica TaxID=400682 RepID=A0A1X7T6Z6_AMPQE